MILIYDNGVPYMERYTNEQAFQIMSAFNRYCNYILDFDMNQDELLARFWIALPDNVKFVFDVIVVDNDKTYFKVMYDSVK